jgi:protein MpaA
MKTINVGRSTTGKALEIMGKESALDQAKILVMSGLHGDELEGVALTTMMVSHLFEKDSELLRQTIFLPIANPDGFVFHQRWNFNKVDLNRNWPTKDWSAKVTNPRYPPGPSAASEVETKHLLAFLEKSSIQFVIDLHSYKDSVLLPLFHTINESLTENLKTLSTELSVPIEYEQDNLGYSISGGFHTWCFENKIQNLTVEVEKGLGQFAIREKYLAPLIKFTQTMA